MTTQPPLPPLGELLAQTAPADREAVAALWFAEAMAEIEAQLEREVDGG